jgi:hypothetical protein
MQHEPLPRLGTAKIDRISVAKTHRERAAAEG